MAKIEITGDFFQDGSGDSAVVETLAVVHDSQGLDWFVFENARHPDLIDVCTISHASRFCNVLEYDAAESLKHDSQFIAWWRALEGSAERNGGPKRIPFQDAHAMCADCVRKVVAKHQAPSGWDSVETSTEDTTFVEDDKVYRGRD